MKSTFEPWHNKMTCAPNEDSDPPGYPHEENLGPWLPIERTVITLMRLG